MDRAATGKPFVCRLTYGIRTVNRTDSLHQTVNGLVGNVDWGESFTVVACEFPSLNRVGARRRAASAWLAEEIFFLENIPPVIVLKPVCPRTLVLKEKLILISFILFLSKQLTI